MSLDMHSPRAGDIGWGVTDENVLRANRSQHGKRNSDIGATASIRHYKTTGREFLDLPNSVYTRQVNYKTIGDPKPKSKKRPQPGRSSSTISRPVSMSSRKSASRPFGPSPYESTSTLPSSGQDKRASTRPSTARIRRPASARPDSFRSRAKGTSRRPQSARPVSTYSGILGSHSLHPENAHPSIENGGPSSKSRRDHPLHKVFVQDEAEHPGSISFDTSDGTTHVIGDTLRSNRYTDPASFIRTTDSSLGFEDTLEYSDEDGDGRNKYEEGFYKDVQNTKFSAYNRRPTGFEDLEDYNESPYDTMRGGKGGGGSSIARRWPHQRVRSTTKQTPARPLSSKSRNQGGGNQGRRKKTMKTFLYPSKPIPGHMLRAPPKPGAKPSQKKDTIYERLRGYALNQILARQPKYRQGNLDSLHETANHYRPENVRPVSARNRKQP